LPGVPSNGVTVLRAELPRVEHELLRAIAVGVDVHEQEKADVTEPAEAEVRNLDQLELGGARTTPARRSCSAAYCCASRSSSCVIMRSYSGRGLKGISRISLISSIA
jgi:hypothetical protein